MTLLSSNETFILGTAQIGGAYGRTNSVGLMSDHAVATLLEEAYAHDVRTFDTARAYGQSEQRIGQFVRAHGLRDLRILTKLDPLTELAPDAPKASVCAAVRKSVDASLSALGVESVKVLMLHKASHLRAYGGAILEALCSYRKQGRIGTIGVSVNRPEELTAALAHEEIRHVQLPFNLLDDRWPSIIEGQGKVTIHVRSIFLQGLLANPNSAVWPSIANYDPEAIISRLVDAAREFGRENPKDLAVSYVRAQPWLNGCVVGVETPEQLLENLQLFHRPPLTVRECMRLRDQLPFVPEALVQPWLWPDR